MSDIDDLGPWFHNLHLPDGRETAPVHPLGDFPRLKWRQLEPFVPRDLSGLTVLDIGCNAGFYSFELARRGAEVTAIDIDPRYLQQARWAARQYDLERRIDFRQGSVYDLASDFQQYDQVWFLGVLYHLRHPLLALDILREVTRGKLFLQTMTMPGDAVIAPPLSIGLDERRELTRAGWPCMAFIERTLADDPTNWWAPNHACVEAMARSAGFQVTAHPGHEIYICEPDPAQWDVIRSLREYELRSVTGRARRNGEAG